VIADFFNFSLSFSTDRVSTRYSNNMNDSNLIINLMFFHSDSTKLNTHCILPNWRLTSDHVPLTITIPISKEHFDAWGRIITKNSNEENMFIKEVIVSFTKLDLSNVSNTTDLEKTVLEFANIVDCTWTKYSKFVNITHCSKSWWNDKCNQDLINYRSSRSIKN